MSGPWHPPAPSLAALPVDRTKTEPKPAYYKLQFGDDYTGFSYYVRTLAVIIGRNCDKAALPPPDYTEHSVPTNPPLTHHLQQDEERKMTPPSDGEVMGNGVDLNGIVDFGMGMDAVLEGLRMDMDEEFGGASSVHDVMLDPSTAQGRAQTTPPLAHDVLAIPGDLPPPSTSAPPELDHFNPSPSMSMQIKLEPESYFDPIFAPPPPPPKNAGPTDHVDVDLGPLKSVSRNHARIEYRNELGHFCLEILGRNGAWVDDRYYVKGSTVPLNQGSQIQIATRIFSFILPPSAETSPYSSYSHEDTANALEDVPYPYNLPPGEVGYAEFYGEPGPGPSSVANMTAGRIPQHFNVFAGGDGLGMGIEGVEGGKVWDDEWDEEDEDDSDSDEDSDDYEEEEEERQEDEEVSTPMVLPKVKIRLKAEPSVDIPSEPEVQVTEDGKKSKTKDKTDPSVSEMDDAAKGQKGGKAPLKANKKKVKAEETSATDVESVPAKPGETASTATQAKNPSPTKTKKANGEDKPPKQKKEPKKKKAAAAASAAPTSTPAALADVKPDLVQAIPEPAATLAALMAQDPSPTPAPPVLKPAPVPTPTPAPSTAPAPKPIPPKAPVPNAGTVPGKPAQAAVQPRPQAPTGAAQAAAAKPTPTPASGPATAKPPTQPTPQSKPLPKPLPKAQPTPQARPAPAIPPGVQKTTPAGSPAPSPVRQNSASSVPAEPPKPFYLTELIETPGRPGHIVVNVPIPPSGAGPRPPPGPLIGLDGKAFIGPPPIKPTATFATIIHRALLFLPRGRGTLGEVCNWVAGEWEWFRLNIDAGWQNSIRHNLSLNKAFLKVPRIPEDDPESKGSVWIIDPEEGPLFEEKQRKDAQKSAGKEKNAEERRSRERQKVEERARKQRDGVYEHATATAAAQHQKPVLPRPAQVPPRPLQRAQAPTAVSANSKGLLQPKAKITVSIQSLTPAHRAKSVIATTDSSGNLLPFACDGTTLTLDQATFGHLTSDIIDKLTLLGAAGAVDVLSAWVINKNKNQAARQAQQAAQASANNKPTAASIKAGLTAPRPNGSASTASTSPAPAPKAPLAKPTPAGAASATSAKPAAAPATKTFGPAPPGASLTKVIGMIAEVANAKGDVNTVGPNAGALLRYIRVVGVDIDLRVAERIWATGVVPPLPAKKGAAAGAAGAGAKVGANGAKVVQAGANGIKPGQVPVKPGVPRPAGAAPAAGAATSVKPAGPIAPSLAAPASKPTPALSAPGVTSSVPAAVPVTIPKPAMPTMTTPAAAGAVKRKLEDESATNEEAKKAKVDAT